MRIDWVRNDYGRSGLLARWADNDAIPPVAELMFDYRLEVLHHDRVAAATAAVFGTYATGGTLRYSNEVSMGVSRAVDASGEGFYMPHLGRDRRPASSELDDGVLSVSWGRIDSAASGESVARREFAIGVLPTDTYSGALLTTEGLEVASNAWLFLNSAHIERSVADSRVRFAVAAMFAGSVGASTVRIPSATPDRFCVELGAAVGLSVMFD